MGLACCYLHAEGLSAELGDETRRRYCWCHRQEAAVVACPPPEVGAAVAARQAQMIHRQNLQAVSDGDVAHLPRVPVLPASVVAVVAAVGWVQRVSKGGAVTVDDET